MNPRKVRAVARKEFYHLIRDFRSLYLAFAIPLLLILLFGYALSLDVDHVKTVVVDFDRTDLSRDFLSRIEASPYFDVIAHVPNIREVTRYLDHGLATMAVLIPPDFTGNIRSDRDAPIQVLFDGSDPNIAGISSGYLTKIVSDYNSGLLRAFLDRSGRESIHPPVEGRIRVWFNEELESRRFIVPGIIAIIIMIVGAILTSLVIAREYENGTMETILSIPLNAMEFLAGKAIPYFLIAMMDVFVAILMGQILFGVVIKGSFWLLLVAASLYLAVALSLGFVISVVTRSQLVANQVAILVTYLPSLLLSDFVFPIENMPKALQAVTWFVPARYFIDILNGLYLRNLGFPYLWTSFAVLAVMAVLLFGAAFRILKREGM
ncbi:MAG TPA: ABC transporter permease [Syntrophales bacterium]|nr:ABC transporter permease [Syntrophales bacterium]HPX10953.1 ABC transporter permease [Syntrophales bacterium]HQB31067.1 ABC transporter permease [Syntrophales bacterium]HQN77615.1 ABC transporter permease [Syntrophales bacterium]